MTQAGGVKAAKKTDALINWRERKKEKKKKKKKKKRVNN